MIDQISHELQNVRQFFLIVYNNRIVEHTGRIEQT
jgi:hypothetical protein